MKKRISGITYLKAFLPLAVISIHARAFGSSSFMSYPFPKYPDIKDIIYSNILTVTVPLFFLVSFYLYLLKRQNSDVSHGKLLGTRTLYFFELFLIWRVIYAVLGVGTVYKKGAGLVENLYLILFGGANSILYYLEVSIYLFVLLEIFQTVIEKLGLNKRLWSLVCFAFFVILLGICNFAVPAGTLKCELFRSFSPIGFLPYVFFASFIFESREDFKDKYVVGFVLLGLIFAILEWKYIPSKTFLDSGYALGIMGNKISTVLFATSIFTLLLNVKNAPSKVVEYMAAISLYVYCIHQIVIKFVYGEVSNPAVGYLLVTVITYALSALIYFVKNYLKKLKNNRISEETK